MTEEKKVTSAAEYYQQQTLSKVVTLPSGLTLRIRKINSREAMRTDAPAFFRTARALSKPVGEDKQTAEFQKLSDENKAALVEVNDNLILTAVVEPRVTKAQEKDAIWIDDITDADYAELIKEITVFSLGRGNLLPFRNDPMADSAGPTGEKV